MKDFSIPVGVSVVAGVVLMFASWFFLPAEAILTTVSATLSIRLVAILVICLVGAVAWALILRRTLAEEYSPGFGVLWRWTYPGSVDSEGLGFSSCLFSSFSWF